MVACHAAINVNGMKLTAILDFLVSVFSLALQKASVGCGRIAVCHGAILLSAAVSGVSETSFQEWQRIDSFEKAREGRGFFVEELETSLGRSFVAPWGFVVFLGEETAAGTSC